MIELSPDHPLLQRWVLVLLLGLLLGLTLGLSLLLDRHEQTHLHDRLSGQAQQLSQHFERGLNERVSAVDRMAKRWEAAGGTPQRLWELDARAYVTDMAQGFLGLRWTDAQGQVRWSYPKALTAGPILAPPGATEPFTMAVLAQAQIAEGPIFSHQIRLSPDKVEGSDRSSGRHAGVGANGMALIRALRLTDREDGYLIAAFDTQELLSGLAQAAVRDQFGLRLACNGEVLYEHDGHSGGPSDEVFHRPPFNSGHCLWQLSLWPSAELLAASRSLLPELVAFIGLLLSLLLAGLYLLWRLGEMRALQAQTVQNMLQTVLDTAPLSIYWKDPQLTYLGCNRHFARDAGMNNPAEVVGKTDFALGWSAQAEYFRNDDRLVIASGQARLHRDEERIDANGKPYWLRSSKVPLRNLSGVVVGILGVQEDITHEKDAELQQRLAATVFEKSHEGVTITDASCRIILVNRAFAEITGYSQQEVLGQKPSILKSGRQDAAFYRQMWQSIRAQGYWRGDIWNRRKDGSIYPETLSITEVRDESGRPLHYIGVFSDISERKQMEQSLQAAKEAAEAANRAKSEFLASMSHELRTPLNAILGFAQLFRMDKDLSHEGREQAEEIERAGSHLLALINDLIDLARIEAGKLNLSREPVAVPRLVADVLKLVEPLARERGIRLFNQVERTPGCQVQADHLRLRQVLINLLTNAIKYNRPQGEVRIFCQNQPGMVSIHVQDTGPGIPEGKQKRVFDYFDRLGAERGSVEGSGIGLVVCKHLAEAMEGDIAFTSAEGVGSTFWISLPEAEASEALGPEQGEPHPSSVQQGETATGGRRLRVLHVEDNPMNRRLMRQILADDARFELEETDSAEAALQLMLSWRPDICLMDINLPGMDGFAALKLLRNNPTTRDLPVIAISANAMKGDAERGLAAGFADYLTKPIDIPNLLASLERHLANQPLLPA
jgi:PAS domain S-box-containing protein